MRVLAIDPGERVGWAHGEIVVPDPRSITQFFPHLVLTGHGITPYKDFALKLHGVAGDYDVIVYETFRLQASKAKELIGDDFPTVQFIGMVRLCAWLASTKLQYQGPAIKETAIRSMKSLRPDLWEIVEPALSGRHDDGHHGDAILHLHHYFWERYV